MLSIITAILVQESIFPNNSCYCAHKVEPTVIRYEYPNYVALLLQLMGQLRVCAHQCILLYKNNGMRNHI